MRRDIILTVSRSVCPWAERTQGPPCVCSRPRAVMRTTHFFNQNPFVALHGKPSQGYGASPGRYSLYPPWREGRLLLLQELVEDVAVATSSRHADLSWARRFAVASPRFIGRRSASTVLSQDCLGRPALRLQSPGESIMQASRAR